MKKSALLVAVIAVVVSACTTSKSGIAMKRKYNKGYYVAFSDKKVKTNESPVADKKSKPTNASNTTLPLTEWIGKDAPNQEALKNQNTDNLTASAVTKKSIDKKQKQADKSYAVKNNIPAAPLLANKKSDLGETQKKALKTEKKGGSSDTNTIILVILCFFPFINLIAMYLKDGKAITTNFWVDLILDFLIFFPGIIFALLVVLDVVNLA